MQHVEFLFLLLRSFFLRRVSPVPTSLRGTSWSGSYAPFGAAFPGGSFYSVRVLHGRLTGMKTRAEAKQAHSFHPIGP